MNAANRKGADQTVHSHRLVCFFVISNNIVTVLKAFGKRTLANVNCYCKMMSVMALDGVTSFLPLKEDTYSCKRMRAVQLFAGFL